MWRKKIFLKNFENWPFWVQKLAISGPTLKIHKKNSHRLIFDLKCLRDSTRMEINGKKFLKIRFASFGQNLSSKLGYFCYYSLLSKKVLKMKKQDHIYFSSSRSWRSKSGLIFFILTTFLFSKMVFMVFIYCLWCYIMK